MKTQVLLISVLTLWLGTRAGFVERMHQTLRDNDSFDWRSQGVISGVKNMGAMSDSVSIVVAEGVESIHAIQAKQPAIDLSVAEVSDCCTTAQHQPKFPGFGCIPVIGGLCGVASYHGGHGTCMNATCKPIATVKGTEFIPTNREDLMKKFIHTSPLAAYIDASQVSFQVYTGGVYADPNCSKTQVDHAVQIVGYGVEEQLDYWIIKNSWGVNWGENGYMRIKRGVDQCAISLKAFFPVTK